MRVASRRWINSNSESKLMSKHTIIASVLLSSSLLATALPAGAISFAGTWSVYRNNTAGVTYTNLPVSATSYHCFLTRVGIEETDTGGENAMCNLIRGSLVWTLEARLGKSSDADAYCSAMCYTNY